MSSRKPFKSVPSQAAKGASSCRRCEVGLDNYLDVFAVFGGRLIPGVVDGEAFWGQFDARRLVQHNVFAFVILQFIRRAG